MEPRQAATQQETRGAGCPQTVWLPMDSISLRHDRSARREDAAGLNELAASISREGLIQAITVRPVVGGRYVIVSGNRRFRACRMAGMKQIEAVVLPIRTADSTAESLLEQLRAGGLHYLQRAALLRELTGAYAVPAATIAAELRCDTQAVESCLRLCGLDGDTQDVIQKEQLPEAMAQALLRVPTAETRVQLAQRAARDGLSVGEVELLATSARTRLPALPPHGQTIGLVRDGRLYLNALRTIAAQMQEAGFPAEIVESTEGRTLTVSVRVSARRRRTERYRSQYSQAVQ